MLDAVTGPAPPPEYNDWMAQATVPAARQRALLTAYCPCLPLNQIHLGSGDTTHPSSRMGAPHTLPARRHCPRFLLRDFVALSLVANAIPDPSTRLKVVWMKKKTEKTHKAHRQTFEDAKIRNLQ